MERYQRANKFICERTIISSACAERLVALIGVRAQQAESAGKGFTWLPAFEQLTATLREHHDESYNDRILPCTAAFAMRLGRTYKPSTTSEQKLLAQSLILYIRNSEGPRYRTIRLLDFWPLIRSQYSTETREDCRTRPTQEFKSS